MKKHMQVLLISLAVLFGGLVAPSAATASQPPTSAGVAAGCYSATCTHKDPSAMGCSADARNLHEFIYRGYRVEYRFSSACYAAWTRWTYVSGEAWSFTAKHEAQINGNIIKNCCAYNAAWTSMFDYHYLSRSCGVSNTGTHCGPWL